MKCSGRNARDSLGYGNAGDTPALLKSSFADACDAGRDRDAAGQVVAVRKRIASDARQAIRQGDAAQADTSRKRIIPDAGDTGGNNNAGDGVQHQERVRPNRRDRHVVDDRRDADIIAARRIVPCDGAGGGNESKIFFRRIAIRMDGHNWQKGQHHQNCQP